MTDAPILIARELRKVFQGFTAVSGVDLAVRRGAIHALIGPNGAGKTTLFNLLTRSMTLTSGSIIYDGTDISRMPPAHVAQLGLVRSFQISAVFPQMTALQNVRVALRRKRGHSLDFWRSKQVLRELDETAITLLDEVGLASQRATVAEELPYGQKRALEIATTLALDPKLLLLDEPTSGMPQKDIERVSALIARIASERTVLMVEHNLSVVADLSDEITVLARGEILAEGDYASIAENPKVVEAYLGRGHA